MLRKLSVTLTAAATALVLGVSLFGQAAPAPKEKKVKDRAEYDLYDGIVKATDPVKQLDLLNQWQTKYPDTDFKEERHQFFIAAFTKANQGPKLFEYCKAFLAADPKDMRCLYYVNIMSIEVQGPAPDVMDLAEKSANSLLGNLDATFAADKKPKEMKEEDFQKQRKGLEALGHNTLGWAAQNKKNNELAEQEFLKSLQVDPNQGRTAQWLGTAMLAQHKVEKQAAALFYIARAASYTGPGESLPAVRQQLDAYLTKVYTNYHGDTSGLAEIKQLATTQAFSPADFKIKSSVEIATEKEEEFKKSNPMMALWMSIRKELAGPAGDAYFTEHLKDAKLPAGIPDVTRFKGKLISMKPATNPKELVIGMSDANTPEVTLKFETALKGKADPGIEIGFEGVASAFTKDPFNLTFEVAKDKLDGWPVQAAPVKKAPVRRPAPKKK